MGGESVVCHQLPLIIIYEMSSLLWCCICMTMQYIISLISLPEDWILVDEFD